MLVTTGRTRPRSFDVKMLAMADRLFTEFDDLPVRTVFQAIGAARAMLRDRNTWAPAPDEIERLARKRLLDAAD